MYESVVVPCNTEYGTRKTDPDIDPRKAIFQDASVEHVCITVVDPRIGVSAEVMIRKDDLPDFVRGKKE